MYTTKHLFLKDLISIILSIAMVLTLLTPTDLTVYAAEEEPDEITVPYREEQEAPEPTYEPNKDLLNDTAPDRPATKEGSDPLDHSDEKNEAAIVSEDSEKKDQYTKDFLLEDTTRLLVVYPDAVHYEKDGKWEDIDNSLELTVDEKTGKEVYRNKANCVEIKLPAEISAEDGPEVTYGNDSLRFTLTGVIGKAGEKHAEEPAESAEAETTEREETEAVQSTELISETEDIRPEETADTEKTVSEEENLPNPEAMDTADATEEKAVPDETEDTDADAEAVEEADGDTEAEAQADTEEQTDAVETELPVETSEEPETESPEAEPVTESETEQETQAPEPETESETEPETETPETEPVTESKVSDVLIPVTPVRAGINNDPIGKEELAAMTERQQKIGLVWKSISG